MGKKYIIELLDECKSKFKGIMLFGLTQEKQISVEMIPEESMTPYIEPEPHAEVTADAYQRGYETAKHECEDCQKNRADAEQELVKKAYDTAYADAEGIYESGKRAMYQKGLKDAWEAARTLWNTPNRKEIFGHTTFNTVLTTLTASEAIEKIRQYEQERKEFHVGDEFKIETGQKFVIIKMDGNKIDRYMDENGTTYCLYYKYKTMRKTGRHFSEIAEVLEKMREGQDGL